MEAVLPKDVGMVLVMRDVSSEKSFVVGADPDRSVWRVKETYISVVYKAEKQV